MMAGLEMSTEAWVWMGAWALVMVLVVWLLVREPRRDAPADRASILRDRFARGELSEEEFTRAMLALDERPAASLEAARHHATHGQEARHD